MINNKVTYLYSEEDNFDQKLNEFLRMRNISDIDIEKIVRSIKNIASTKDAINFYVERSIKKYITFKGKITILNLEKFRQEPKEIKFKIVNKIIEKTTNSYYPPRSKKVLNLIDGFQRNRVKKLTLGGCIFERKNRFLFVSKER